MATEKTIKLLKDALHLMDEKGRRGCSECGQSYVLSEEYWNRLRLDIFQALESAKSSSEMESLLQEPWVAEAGTLKPRPIANRMPPSIKGH